MVYFKMSLNLIQHNFCPSTYHCCRAWNRSWRKFLSWLNVMATCVWCGDVYGTAIQVRTALCLMWNGWTGKVWYQMKVIKSLSGKLWIMRSKETVYNISRTVLCLNIVCSLVCFIKEEKQVAYLYWAQDMSWEAQRHYPHTIAFDMVQVMVQQG